MARVVEIKECPVERAHAKFSRLGHYLLELVKFAFENPVGDGRCIDQNLKGGFTAITIHSANQALRDDGAQVCGKIHQQLTASLFGEKIDDAIHLMAGTVGVQRSQTQMTGYD